MNLPIIIALPLLSGCGVVDSIIDVASAGKGTTPIVRASNGGIAHMTLISCPRTEAGLEAARAILEQMVAYNSELVIARSGGSAALTINACPAGAPGAAPVPAAPRR